MDRFGVAGMGNQVTYPPDDIKDGDLAEIITWIDLAWKANAFREGEDILPTVHIENVN